MVTNVVRLYRHRVRRTTNLLGIHSGLKGVTRAREDSMLFCSVRGQCSRPDRFTILSDGFIIKRIRHLLGRVSMFVFRVDVVLGPIRLRFRVLIGMVSLSFILVLILSGSLYGSDRD